MTTNIDEIECPQCDGNGYIRIPPFKTGPICHACTGRGWREPTDDEQEAAWQRQQDDAMSEPPITMDEQHRAAWAQKQALRS